MNKTEKLDFLIEYLKGENEIYKDIDVPNNEEEKFKLYRSFVNVRPAVRASEAFLEAEDSFLKELTLSKGITDIKDLAPVEENIYLWKGDITTLKCGAIVNAANSGMTGCWQPCHSCIDNCIHTFAGVRLRYKCNEIMRAQGYEEPTGTAKITPSYNLPCDYVIHTVGPIVRSPLGEEHKRLLESSYRSCLELAKASHIESIAFCCISTGVFGFPQEAAAEIAVRTAKEFLKDNKMKVIFNVFTGEDYEIYNRLLGGNKKA